MRVLFGVRPDLHRDFGGDTMQILRTCEHLRELGVTVELSDALGPDPAGFDLVHLFHLTRVYETHCQLRAVRARGKVPIVLSPIYWPTDEYDARGRFGVERCVVRFAGSAGWERLKAAGKWFRTDDPSQRRALASTVRQGFAAQQRELVAAAAMVLPNAHAEADVLRARFDIDAARIHVVHNGCDGIAAPPAGPVAPRDPRHVLCVGRVEPRKNQLRVIRALRNTHYRLTIVGNAGVYHDRYLRACRRAAAKNVTFVPRAEPAALAALYRSAAVHLCASWYETPGLVNLEAGLAGCRLVVTDRGSVREYFADTAHYCEPDDVVSIRQAVDRAAATPHDPDAIAAHVRRFSWRGAAEATLAAYEKALR